jgi:hypothetical protein
MKRRLRRAFCWAAEEHPHLSRFLTVTLTGPWHRETTWGGPRRPNPAWNGSTPREAVQELSRMWAEFCKKVERFSGQRLQYAAVREPHEDGTPHMHALVGSFLPKEKLSQWWADVGGGYTRIELVDPQRVGAYMSKYLSKEVCPVPKGCRKYATGGGVKLREVRGPPRTAPPGSWWLESRLEDGRWWGEIDGGAAVAWAMRMAARPPDAEREALRAKLAAMAHRVQVVPLPPCDVLGEAHAMGVCACP